MINRSETSIRQRKRLPDRWEAFATGACSKRGWILPPKFVGRPPAAANDLRQTGCPCSLSGFATRDLVRPACHRALPQGTLLQLCAIWKMPSDEFNGYPPDSM